MADIIKPWSYYNGERYDPFVGHLETPITSSSITRAILKNLPAYRFGLTPLLRGLEIGLAHGYFLIGPFIKLGPLRNSDVALFAGFLSTIGLIIILTLGLTIYGAVVFQRPKVIVSNEPSTLPKKLVKAVQESLEVEADILESANILQTRAAWTKFKGGFFVGACGSAGFAFICLSSIPLFTIT